MEGFFTHSFWSALAIAGMIVFLLFGVDLFFGAKLMTYLSRAVNRKFQVDRMIVNALEELKKSSDREFDVESSIINGWGRFVMGGLLIFGAVLLLLNVLPSFRQ